MHTRGSISSTTTSIAKRSHGGRRISGAGQTTPAPAGVSNRAVGAIDVYQHLLYPIIKRMATLCVERSGIHQLTLTNIRNTCYYSTYIGYNLYAKSH